MLQPSSVARVAASPASSAHNSMAAQLAGTSREALTLSLSLSHRSRQLTVLTRSAGQVSRLMVSSWSAKQHETNVWHALLSVRADGTLICKLRRCSCGLAL